MEWTNYRRGLEESSPLLEIKVKIIDSARGYGRIPFVRTPFVGTKF